MGRIRMDRTRMVRTEIRKWMVMPKILAATMVDQSTMSFLTSAMNMACGKHVC
jgi:hypothetical protein